MKLNGDFTLPTYKKMLMIAIENGYKFISYKDRLQYDKFCLLRHDIDADPTAAFEMAKLEASIDVKATYFFMIRSPLYNLFSRSADKIVREIIEMGHYISIHYDEGYYPVGCDTCWLIDFEAGIIEKNFNCTVDVVSFHQPSERVLKNNIKIRLINVYDKEDMRGIVYISDSNMIWKDKHPIEIFNSSIYSKIQLLIHPLWWVGDGQDTSKKWDEAIIRNFHREQKQLLETEAAYGSNRSLILKKQELKNGNQ